MSGLRGRVGARDRFSAAMNAFRNPDAFRVRQRGFWSMEGRTAPIILNPKTGLSIVGDLKWRVAWENLVVNQGLDHLLGVELAGTPAATTSWFLALLKTTPTVVAGSTYQNFMGTANSEVTAYTSGTRLAWTAGTVSGQSVSNSGSPAVFTINANGTVIGGAALVSNSTKNDTTAGRFMYAAGAFTAADKSLDNTDTLTVTATFTSADDGI